MNYKERYVALVKRTQKPENKELYNQIHIMTEGKKQERLIKLFWKFHPDGLFPSSTVDGVPIKDMEPKLAHQRLDGIENLLDELGWD